MQLLEYTDSQPRSVILIYLARRHLRLRVPVATGNPQALVLFDSDLNSQCDTRFASV